ncbi:hypothetical protein ACN1C3_02585, partial [Pseudomonas sp. H11T01]|uniref:hypothetical protein n=1 Tax=Pseudomonas sp. H11T01 TaxID=3402749 RepID=UPI003AC2DFBA
SSVQTSLGFEKTLNLAQQSLVTSLISRGVTCDADNLVDYQSDSTSTHTNCLIQLLKSGWLRSFVSTEARILRFPLSLSSGYFSKLSKFPLQLQPLGASDHSLAGGEFYSVTRCCQHLFYTAFDRVDRTVNNVKQHDLINSFGLR